MNLSPYCLVMPYDNGSALLYNSANGSLIQLESKYVSDGKINLNLLNAEEIELIKNLGFFMNRESVLNMAKETYNTETKVLVVIVELTSSCNLNCSYCYQHNWGSHGTISDKIILNVIQYIDKVTNIHDFEAVRLDFIGGEPLLAAKEMLDTYKGVYEVCKRKGLALMPGLDTNGTLICKEILKQFHALNMSVTLSTKKDHDQNRPFKNGKGSYNKIVDNLVSCEDIFKENNIRLSIRYNTHHDNYLDFDIFLKEFSKLNLTVDKVEAAYTDEYTYNSFVNKMTKYQFIQWNSTDNIDLLIQNGFRVSYFPQNALRACKAYQPYNCKVFSDGSVGLCDSWKYGESNLYIEEIAKNPSRLNEYFKAYKKWSPLTDQECVLCDELVMCGGKYFCKSRPCEYSKYDVPMYLRKYVYYSNNGFQHLFPNLE